VRRNAWLGGRLDCRIYVLQRLPCHVVVFLVFKPEPVLRATTTLWLNSEALTRMHIPRRYVSGRNDLAPMHGDSFRVAAGDLDHKTATISIELKGEQINAVWTLPTKVREGSGITSGTKRRHDDRQESRNHRFSRCRHGRLTVELCGAHIGVWDRHSFLDASAQAICQENSHSRHFAFDKFLQLGENVGSVIATRRFNGRERARIFLAHKQQCASVVLG